MLLHLRFIVLQRGHRCRPNSGRVRKGSLKRLAATDADTKAKEMLFLKDEVGQLEMQVSIVQKRIKKQQKRPHYTIRERLSIY